jgi:GNAT superfamily N-acetyltransferase
VTTLPDNVRIRDAAPADAAFLARVLLLAARSHLEDRPGIWDRALGGTETDCLTYLEQLALADEQCLTHWRHFVVAEVDGCSAAALAGYEPSIVGGRFCSNALSRADLALGRLSTGWTQAWLRAFDVMKKCAWPEEMDPGAWIIESVATLPGFRGHGLMTALLQKTLEIGRARGCSLARVHVLIGNERAERVYIKAGFTVAGEKPHPDFEALFGAPGMKLLTRALS